jgi:hypothetical protein
MKQFILLFSAVLVIFGCSSNNNGTVTVVPSAPTNLTGAVISTTQINLSWTDNATNEEGYKIERKTGAGNYTVVGSTSSNMTTFSDLGLTPSTSYTYRVYAYNSAGNSLQYSNEVTISTQDSIPSWLTNGLVAYYPFNGNANDESGNGNNGTVNGATLASDRNGNGNSAYSFNGINNLIRIPHQTSLNLVGDFSASIWYKVVSFPSNDNGHTLIAKRDDNGVCCSSNVPWDFSITYQVSQAPAHYKLPFCAFAKNGSYVFSEADNTVSLNDWQNINYTYSNDTLKIYLNNVLISSKFFSSLNRGFNNSDILIGSVNREIGAEWMNGSLDDIRIYNRALSASEVAYLAAH